MSLGEGKANVAIKDKLNDYQRGKRATRIASRRVVAAQLQGQIRQSALYTFSFIHRGFFARLKWLLFGEPMPRREDVDAGQ